LETQWVKWLQQILWQQAKGLLPEGKYMAAFNEEMAGKSR
jgi:hypothetical protein